LQTYSHETVQSLINHPKRIEKASLDEIRALLTAYVGSERFGDGNWEAGVMSGLIRRILDRIQALRPQILGSSQDRSSTS
jgi:hypothetical protein